jgi:hypothetical protein
VDDVFVSMNLLQGCVAGQVVVVRCSMLFKMFDYQGTQVSVWILGYLDFPERMSGKEDSDQSPQLVRRSLASRTRRLRREQLIHISSILFHIFDFIVFGRAGGRGRRPVVPHG